MIKIKTLKIRALTQYSKIITLPKFWVKAHKLEPGDKISVYVNNENDLLIIPDKK